MQADMRPTCADMRAICRAAMAIAHSKRFADIVLGRAGGGKPPAFILGSASFSRRAILDELAKVDSQSLSHPGAIAQGQTARAPILRSLHG